MSELAQCPACGKFAAGASEWSRDQAVRCPHCQAEFVLGEAIVQSLPRLARVADRPDDALPDATPPAVAEKSAAAGAPPLAESSVGAPSTPAPSTYAVPYDFLPLEKKQQLETAGAVAARLRASARRQRRSCLRELIKVATGGMVGLAIGYWVLNYVGGPRFDLLKVYLPGCPDTYDHWPAEYFPAKSAEPAAVPQSSQTGGSIELAPLENAADLPKLEGLDEAQSQK